MAIDTNTALQQFDALVGIRFQLYNSLFTSLPFHRIERTGTLLSLFLLHCEDGFKKEQSPVEIIDSFLQQYTSYVSEHERTGLLFRFIQYAERQVVLFDALEDASFLQLNDPNGPGTLRHLPSEIQKAHKQDAVATGLKDLQVRFVLTAHPTQFYPGSVLGIISDLSEALKEDNVSLINAYLRQLGKTPFLNKTQPSPYEEAVNLMWYLENIFYPAAGNAATLLKAGAGHIIPGRKAAIRVGFWPGGDRDGNQFVKTETTERVAAALRKRILRNYHREVRGLKRRLSFRGVEEHISALERMLHQALYTPGFRIEATAILASLQEIHALLVEEHNSLFVELVEELINKVEIFGLYFASLDIRQDSSIHSKAIAALAGKIDGLPADYAALTDEEKAGHLAMIKMPADAALPTLDDEVQQDTLEVMRAIRGIQQSNGPEGCDRYIISHCTSALNVLEVYALLQVSGWQKDKLTVDIIPLFETIGDLEHAGDVMKSLYANDDYSGHLRRRQMKQTIMLGFSDGTKDGGYLMANWSIYKAKEELTRISREAGVEVAFFDGRGGPPARGGGKTNQFYSSMGKNIATDDIQLTIQGQTISSSFGTIPSAQYNIEQLIHAGISTNLLSPKAETVTAAEGELLDMMARSSYDAYVQLKNTPGFLKYLSEVSPLRYYGDTNIGSRPSRRNTDKQLNLDDLRAIPYVGAWSQLKQNVPGYYGVGTALQMMDKCGKLDAVRQMYQENIFFRTLMDNCEMAMKKSFFPLTRHVATHPDYGPIWQMVYDEYELTRNYLLSLTGGNELMEAYPTNQVSIQMRERIILPLLTIQQYGMQKLREEPRTGGQRTDYTHQTYEKLILRCSFGIINAGRNSV